MQWGKRGPGSPSRRRRATFRPDSESLEGRRLLTTFDLTQTQTAPYGVEFVGKTIDVAGSPANNIAGYTVTDVGNVTGSGYDSFVIAATGDANSTVAFKPLNPTFTQGSAAYLVFGSKTVNLNTVASYLTLANGVAGTNTSGALVSGQRAGDLGELGTLGVAAQTDIPNPVRQTNPTLYQPQPPQAATHAYGFTAPVPGFDGLTFVTGLNKTTGLGTMDGLGYSVTALGDIDNSNTYDSFAISAPNDTGGGRVFVIYGGTTLANQSTSNKTIDLEPTPGAITTTAPTKVVSFYDSQATATSEVGYSIAGIGNYFGTTSYSHDLAIGAPGLTVAGVGADTGVVFTVSGSYIQGLQRGASVDLSKLYGTSTTSASTAGIEYTGFIAGGELGYSVSTAGNFDGAIGVNALPIDDLLIGAPHLSPTTNLPNAAGAAYLVYGKQPLQANQTLGTTQSLSTLATPLVTAQGVPLNPLQGSIFKDNLSDGFGFSVSTAGDFNNDGVDDIMIGAPYYSQTAALGNEGYVAVVYGVKGTATNIATTRLNQIVTISPTVGVATTAIPQVVVYTGAGAASYAGFSISSSGHIQIGTSTTTEPIFDILIGAPGGTGTAYLVPGTGAGATTPVASSPLSLSNINTAPINGSSFTATGTSDVAIVAGGLGTSVNARNLVVDPEPTTTFNTVDPDEVPDLFFGAPYSSLLNPNNLVQTLRTLAGVAYVVEGSLLGGTASTGTSTTTTTSASAPSVTSKVSFLNPVVFTGADNGLPNPPISALSHLTSYAPLPVQVAEQQFRPQPGFVTREAVYTKPTSKKGGAHQAPAGTTLVVDNIRHSENEYSKVNTLRVGVRTRGKTKVGTKTTFTHAVKVIPTNLQTETYPG